MAAVIKFKTNINCPNCKAKVSNFLNSEPSIKKWEVDLENPDKILTVEGESITEDLIKSAVGKAGFKAEKI